MHKSKSQKRLDFNQMAFLIAKFATEEEINSFENKAVHLSKFRVTVTKQKQAKNSKRK